MAGEINKRILHFDWEVSNEEFSREKKIRWGCYTQFNSLFIARQSLVGQGPLFIEGSQSHSDTPQSVGLLWKRERPLLDNTQHSQQRGIHNPAGLEPATPGTERPQTHALDRAATGIGII
jgi:hypothetical protein